MDLDTSNYLTLLDFIIQEFFIFMLCMARIGAFVNFFPVTSGQALTGLWITRTVFVMGLSLFIYPTVSAQITTVATSFSVSFAILTLKEIIIGYMIAYLFAPIIWVADGIGGFIDGQRGTGQENNTDLFTDEQTTPLGTGIIQTVIVLIMVSGALVSYLGFVFESYIFWPPHTFFPDFSNKELLGLFISRLAITVEMVLLLASPVVIATFLADWSLGLMNQFAQQLNVYVLAPPVKSAVALLLLVLYGGVLFSLIYSSVANTPVFIEEIRGVFGKGISL
ncbi:MAG: EscT/YscT/HrcT family type III secretion system export apparatus protein [Desulfovibrionaceae bacterium]